MRPWACRASKERRGLVDTILQHGLGRIAAHGSPQETPVFSTLQQATIDIAQLEMCLPRQWHE